MGLWQKTMFYLGLVDEDSVEVGEGGAERRPQPSREQVSERRTSRAPAPDRTTDSRPRRAGVGRSDDTSPGRARERAAGASPGVSGRRVEPPLPGRRRPAADRALSDAGVVVTPADQPLVRTVTDADLESQVIVARSYNDAQVLADHIRATIPVVLDLRKVEPAMVRRLVDFSSGLTYALGGSMRKIGQGVVLVLPANVNLSRDERRRLRDLGYYQAPEES
jgi:cell division inhibitor SepF